MAHRLQRLRGLKPELIPPRGAKPVGVHSDGRIIYEMERLDLPAIKDNKVQRKDKDGNPMFRKHPTTGEEMYPILDARPIRRTARFVLRGTRNGHVRIEEHFDSTPEQAAADAAKAAQKQFSDDLAAEATKRGVTAGELVSRLLDSSAASRVDEAIQYPNHVGGGWWELSDGTRIRGNRDAAEMAEAELLIAVPDDGVLNADYGEDSAVSGYEERAGE